MYSVILDRCKTRVVSALILLCLWSVGFAYGWIESVALEPAEPTTGDTLHVMVSGYFPDGCWSVADHACQPMEAGELSMDIDANDSWYDGALCPPVIETYERICKFFPLNSGRYVLTVTEHHQSDRYPDPDTVTVEFDVPPTTSIINVSWGYLRTIFR